MIIYRRQKSYNKGIPSRIQKAPINWRPFNGFGGYAWGLAPERSEVMHQVQGLHLTDPLSPR